MNSASLVSPIFPYSFKTDPSNEDNWKQENAALNAPLTSTPLLALILNGTFDSANATNPNYGWSTRGDSAVINGQAILGESDRFNSNLSQSFTILEGAKYLQFTLVDTQLGASTKYDPSDTFEVALLDANTLAPLAGTATGLTQTDALLNIQQDGTTYLSPFVTLKGSTSDDILTLGSPMTFMVDVSNIAPGTEAKLYFDLLGFGDRNSQVILDSVRLLSGNAIPLAVSILAYIMGISPKPAIAMTFEVVDYQSYTQLTHFQRVLGLLQLYISMIF